MSYEFGYTMWNTRDARGAFSLALESGIMAAGLTAGSEIFQWRWNPTVANVICVPRLIRCNGGAIAAFTAGYGSFSLKSATAWSADGTGGNAVSFAQTQDQRKRKSGAEPQLPTVQTNTGVRIATTAALGAGTKTFDTNPLVVGSFGVAATAGAYLGTFDSPLWMQTSEFIYPVSFATNEGFSILATVPATGTWTFGIVIEWDEFNTFM